MTPAWQVWWDPNTAKDLKRLGRPAAERIRKAVQLKLAKDPNLGKQLKTPSKVPLFRYRVGDYRIIYTLRDKDLIVLVLRIGHRREIYRRIT